MTLPVLLAALILSVTWAGCAPTKQARSLETSGFLGTLYPMMHEGKDGEGLLVYKNPLVATIPQGTYKKILLDHAQVWGPPTQDPKRLEQAQHVADLLYSMAHQSLAKDYEMVSEAAPNTLHIQAAITRADPAYVVLRAISTVPAPMNVLALTSLLKNLGTGKPLFVGDVSVEVKISDAQTGQVLGASADRRVGKKRLDLDSFDSWDDVHKALAYWAEKIRYRLCRERQGEHCVEPKE